MYTLHRNNSTVRCSTLCSCLTICMIWYPINDLKLRLSKREVPRDVRNSKVRRQDKFRRDWSRHSSKVGQDQVSGGISVLCWHAAPVAYVLWKPFTIRLKFKFGNKVQICNGQKLV